MHARRGEIRNFTLLSYFGVPRVLLLSLDMWCQRRARFQNDGGWPKRMLSSTSGQDAIMKPHSPIEVRRRRAGLMPAAVSLGEEEREKERERERPLLCHFGSSREWSKAAASRQKRASKPTGAERAERKTRGGAAGALCRPVSASRAIVLAVIFVALLVYQPGVRNREYVGYGPAGEPLRAPACEGHSLPLPQRHSGPTGGLPRGNDSAQERGVVKEGLGTIVILQRRHRECIPPGATQRRRKIRPWRQQPTRTPREVRQETRGAHPRNAGESTSSPSR